MNPSTALATVLVDELVRQGVRDVVLSPGSRNAPLAFALHTADAANRLRLHVRIDERTAAFLALGLAKGGAMPAAVVTTSGTATANLHPAVLEAAHSGIPLVVVTADRPPELRATGANQTTDQTRLYGGATRYFADVPAADDRVGQVRFWRNVVSQAVAAATGARTADPGPVQLNVAFRDPLVPDGDSEWPESLDRDAGATRVARAGQLASHALPRGPRTVVVAGDDPLGKYGRQARQLAETGGWPLLAEPSSGARSGPNALGPYRLLLDHEPLGSGVERVVVFGRPTLSRPVQRLLARADIEVVVVAPHGEWADAGRNAALVVPAVAVQGAADDGEWLRRWLACDSTASAAVGRVLDEELRHGLIGGAVARALAERLQPRDLLVAGSSNPIRDLDLAAPPFADGVRVLANRGLAGIDGTVSTAVGAALAQRPRAAYALMGDLTFLHDANGLLLGPDEPRPDLTIVVVNDDGGGIFGLLEQGGAEHAAAFERVFGTPHGTDLGALCAASSTPHRKVSTLDELADALEPGAGIGVVEVPVNRRRTRAVHSRLRDAVAEALP